MSRTLLLTALLLLAPTHPLLSREDLHGEKLAVGQSGDYSWLTGKIRQVLDDNRVLVGIEDSRTNRGRYDTVVLLKMPTKGMTDDRAMYLEDWQKAAPSGKIKVSGTYRYKTTTGATKTVLVLEDDPGEAKTDRPVTPAPLPGKKSTRPLLTGRDAYSDYIPEVRKRLERAYDAEIDRVKEVIKREEASLASKALSQSEEVKSRRTLYNAKNDLLKLEKNVPPYLNMESLKNR